MHPLVCNYERTWGNHSCRCTTYNNTYTIVRILFVHIHNYTCYTYMYVHGSIYDLNVYTPLFASAWRHVLVLCVQCTLEYVKLREKHPRKTLPSLNMSVQLRMKAGQSADTGAVVDKGVHCV